MSTIARIVSINQGSRFAGSVSANREMILGLLDQALKEEPDIVCLPEAFPAGGLAGVPLSEKVESVPGPSTDACAERARRGRCYVICPIKTERSGRYWNSAVILDRDGQVIGIYDKLCPVTSTHDYTEMEGGVTPGSQVPVFDLDFGRVGVQICFDAGFPENWQELAGEGARLIFWTSAYDGGFPLRCYAWLHRNYVVSSVRAGRARVIDPLGAIVAESGTGPGLVSHRINLDNLVFHNDFNHTVAAQAAERYGQRVEVRNSAPGSGHLLLEPRDADLECSKLAKELGLEPASQYHQRHREAYARLRAGETAPPQKAAHGRRAQYPED